jgi:hypothetical protein
MHINMTFVQVSFPDGRWNSEVALRFEKDHYVLYLKAAAHLPEYIERIKGKLPEMEKLVGYKVELVTH